MRAYHILVLLICAGFQSVFGWQEQAQNSQQEPLYKELIVKKKIDGRICDSCQIDFAHIIGETGSFVIAGAGHAPSRLSHFRDSIAGIYQGHKATSEHIFIVSGAKLNLTFLPNFKIEKGKRVQLYRSFGDLGFEQLELTVLQNGKSIQPWVALSTLGEAKEYAFLGRQQVSGQDRTVAWPQTFFAGNYQLALKDTLRIIVRNIPKKSVVQTISIFRAVDRPTNFIYYQVPINNEQFSQNLQNILNVIDEPSKIYNGDTLDVFEKDFNTIGIMRFLGVGMKEQIQYSFDKKPYNWHSISSINSENGVFLILGNDMAAGKSHEVYLRYKTQPETVHKITVKVKDKPLEIPWVGLALFSILLLIFAGIGFFLWQNHNKTKLAKLKSKTSEIESRLELLSGQLNPHFLFNSLNAIQGNIRSGDPDKVYTYIGNVATFMRNVIDNSKREFISLQEELNIESDYLRLEQERMRFDYIVNVDSQVEPTLIDIPPLLLQPVLENSIRHGFGHQSSPSLHIYVFKRESDLIIRIADSGAMEWDPRNTRYGHGLSLTAKRIAVYNEKIEGMTIQMEVSYIKESGTITIFTFQDWLA